MEKVIEYLLSKIPFLTRRLDFHMREVVTGASVAMILRVFGAGLALCFNVLLARIFGAGGVGLYLLSITVAMIVTSLCDLGMGTTLLRFVAANASIGNWKIVKGVYTYGMKLGLSSSVVLTLVIFLAAPWLSTKVFHKPDLTAPLRWISLSIPPAVFIGLQSSALQGLKRIQDWIIVSIVGVNIFSLVGLWCIRGKTGVEWAGGVYTLSTLLTAGMGFWLWKRATPQLREVRGEIVKNEILESCIPLFGMSFLWILTTWASIFILGIWANKAEVGIFGTANRVASVIGMILIAFNSISAPKFAALYRKKDLKTLDLMARQSTQLMTGLVLPIVLLIVIFPKFILGIFGPEFREGALPLVILTMGQFVNVATGQVGSLLMMTGHEKLLLKRSIFMSLFCVILNLVLISQFGILGAAIATATCMALGNLISVYLVRWKLGIWTIPFLSRVLKNG